MSVDIVTVALLTPILVGAMGDYVFPFVAIAAQTENNITVQGAPVYLDEQGYGLGVAVLPVMEGRNDYRVAVNHGLVEQELTVTVIGKKPPVVAWWLAFAPLGALLLSVRIHKI